MGNRARAREAIARARRDVSRHHDAAVRCKTWLAGTAWYRQSVRLIWGWIIATMVAACAGEEADPAGADARVCGDCLRDSVYGGHPIDAGSDAAWCTISCCTAPAAGQDALECLGAEFCGTFDARPPLCSDLLRR